MIAFVSGGARSGKSSLAERAALFIYKKEIKVQEDARLVYLATAKRMDQEMKRRIFIHRQERAEDWLVVEEPYHISSKLKLAQKGDVLLIDCVTIWLSNMLFDYKAAPSDILEEAQNWLKTARKKELTLLIVSNDLNEEVPSIYESVHQYMYILEKLHQLIVEQSDIAIQVTAGIPAYWKGEDIFR